MREMTCSDYYEDITYVTLNGMEADCEQTQHELTMRIARETNPQALVKLRECLALIERAKDAVWEAKDYLAEVIDDTQTVFEHGDF